MTSTCGSLKISRYKIEKFNVKDAFLLEDADKKFTYFRKIAKTLAKKEKKYVSMKDEDLEELNLKTRAVIILCLERDVLFFVNEEATVIRAWSKLDNNFMRKTITNQIYLKYK